MARTWSRCLATSTSSKKTEVTKSWSGLRPVLCASCTSSTWSVRYVLIPRTLHYLYSNPTYRQSSMSSHLRRRKAVRRPSRRRRRTAKTSKMRWKMIARTAKNRKHRPRTVTTTVTTRSHHTSMETSRRRSRRSSGPSSRSSRTQQMRNRYALALFDISFILTATNLRWRARHCAG